MHLIKRLINWLVKPFQTVTPPPPTIEYLCDTALKQPRLIPYKGYETVLDMYSPNCIKLVEWIADANKVMSQREYIGGNWRRNPAVIRTVTLTDYLCDDEYIIDTKTFNEEFVRLTTLFIGYYEDPNLEEHWIEYYHRVYNPIYQDIRTYLETYVNSSIV